VTGRDGRLTLAYATREAGLDSTIVAPLGTAIASPAAASAGILAHSLVVTLQERLLCEITVPSVYGNMIGFLTSSLRTHSMNAGDKQPMFEKVAPAEAAFLQYGESSRM